MGAFNHISFRVVLVENRPTQLSISFISETLNHNALSVIFVGVSPAQRTVGLVFLLLDYHTIGVVLADEAIVDCALVGLLYGRAITLVRIGIEYAENREQYENK